MIIDYDHQKTVVFWIALIYVENVYSFAWLFKTFLQAMSGKAPKPIITYRDAAVANAISQLTLNT